MAIMLVMRMLVFMGIQRGHQARLLASNYQPLHFLNGLFQAHKEGARNDRVTDVQLVDTCLLYTSPSPRD